MELSASRYDFLDGLRILDLADEKASFCTKLLADMGVYPFVVPLRPIPGSRMQNAVPPSPDRMKRIYDGVSRILSRKGISSRQSLAGCVRCGACSGLPACETPADPQICHRARTETETREAYAIRNEVFVKEQGLFFDTDIDAHDDASIHIEANAFARIVFLDFALKLVKLIR